MHYSDTKSFFLILDNVCPSTFVKNFGSFFFSPEKKFSSNYKKARGPHEISSRTGGSAPLLYNYSRNHSLHFSFVSAFSHEMKRLNTEWMFHRLVYSLSSCSWARSPTRTTSFDDMVVGKNGSMFISVSFCMRRVNAEWNIHTSDPCDSCLKSILVFKFGYE